MFYVNKKNDFCLILQIIYAVNMVKLQQIVPKFKKIFWGRHSRNPS